MPKFFLFSALLWLDCPIASPGRGNHFHSKHLDSQLDHTLNILLSGAGHIHMGTICHANYWSTFVSPHHLGGVTVPTLSIWTRVSIILSTSSSLYPYGDSYHTTTLLIPRNKNPKSTKNDINNDRIYHDFGRQFSLFLSCIFFLAIQGEVVRRGYFCDTHTPTSYVSRGHDFYFTHLYG